MNRFNAALACSDDVVVANHGASSWFQTHKFLEQLRRIVAKGLRDLTELDHVNPTLAPLHLRYEALGAVQAGGKLDLSDAGSLTCRDKELKKFLMPLREDRGWQ